MELRADKGNVSFQQLKNLRIASLKCAPSNTPIS